VEGTVAIEAGTELEETSQVAWAGTQLRALMGSAKTNAG
jgi:hypothetical protein